MRTRTERETGKTVFFGEGWVEALMFGPRVEARA